VSTPRRLADRYELGELVGFGGMAEVFRARDTRLQRDVAIKILRTDLARDPVFHARFQREAKNAAALNHAAIVAVHDTGETDANDGALPFIVMELVDGRTLRDVLRTEGTLSPKRAIEIVADVCQALSFSHQHGIVHRDIKPANIMIGTTGAVKVMDFGIARAITDTGDLTQTAAVLGTAHYLSPEQAHGEDVDHRSDIYSLGCVLYELLTGEPPFTGDTPVSVAYQHVRKDPTPPSKRNPAVSPALDAVVMKALAKNPDNRFQSAAEFRADLMRVYIGQTPEAPKVLSDAERSSMGGSPVPPSRRSRLLVVLAVVVVIAVAAVIAVRAFAFGDVRVPQLRSQTEQEAVSTLQGLGFRTTTSGVTDPDVESGLVVGTDPPADSMASRDDEVTVKVSVGPSQQKIPSVAGSSPEDAENTLKAAGFTQIRRGTGVSKPEEVGKVTGTVPEAGQLSAVTNPVTIMVGGGPGTTPVPPVAGQPFDSAQRVLQLAGFTKLIQVPVDGTQPVNEVVGTDPPAGQTVSFDTLIQVRTSLANQFVMPPLTGLVWDDDSPTSAMAVLRSYGWTGTMTRIADTPSTAQRSAQVVVQNPAAGTPFPKNGVVTLSFAP
jgi:eukaryotic-like serine/threonine-protein kinase